MAFSVSWTLGRTDPRGGDDGGSGCRGRGPGQVEEVGPFGVVELQGPGHRVQHALRNADRFPRSSRV